MALVCENIQLSTTRPTQPDQQAWRQRLNRELLPSVSGLLAFECVARHSSITAAASELNLTQSAVSRQIRQLEDFLTITLFQRVRQRVLLTDSGRTYLEDVSRILKDLVFATQRTTISANESYTLNLAVTPTFAARWLVPRLKSFLNATPGVTVNLSVRRGPFELATEALDGAIHYGDANWPGASARRLAEERLLPVCSPRFWDEHNLQIVDSFASASLLHQATRPWAWPDWFRQIGLTRPDCSEGARFDEGQMLTQAAICGMGVALIPKFAIDEDLTTGRLIQATQLELVTGKGYYLVVPESKAPSTLMKKFSAWVVDQAESYFRASREQRPSPRKDLTPASTKNHRPSSGKDLRVLVPSWDKRLPQIRSRMS